MPDAPLFWVILSALVRCIFVIITVKYLYICDYYHCVSVILVSR